MMRSHHQRGMTLISVLAALLIFVFGLLALAGLYGRLMAAQTGNELVTSTQAFGNRFWALLQAQPALVQTLGGSNGTTVTYQQSSISTAPAGLQPLLRDIFSNPPVNLPGSTVTITLGNDAVGTACTAPAAPAPTICGVALSIRWTPPGGTARSQSFSYQVGDF
jgi:type II secretory pathway pseudopilin PulG